MSESEPIERSTTQPPLSARLQHALAIALIALTLGLAFEILFDGHRLGISFPIWATLCVAGLLASAYIEGVTPSRVEAALALPVLLLAWMTIFREEPFTIFLGVAGTLVLFALWIRTFRAGALPRFGWLDFATALIWVPVETWLRPWATSAAAWRDAVGEKGASGRGSAVLRGLVLALPALIIFTALLAAADMIFQDLVEQALSWLNIDWLLETFGRTLLTTAAALVSLGALVAALIQPGERRLQGEEKPLMAPFLGFTESAIILGAVDLLFFLFVLVQFRYFFGGEANITAAGYTYSEYARRGFGELVTVAFLSLGMILALGYFSKRESSGERVGFNALSAFLVAMLGVMLVSALQRLLLYEGVYGFTRLRTYTHVFIPWLGALLVIFVVLLFIGRLRPIAPLSFLVGLGFVVSMAALNIDAFIVQRNIERYEQGEELDVYHLFRLSSDAMPGVVAFAAGASEDLQDELLPELACRRDRMLEAVGGRTWQSLHVSRSRALEALLGSPLVGAYEAGPDDEWPRTVIGPDGRSHECVNYYGWD